MSHALAQASLLCEPVAVVEIERKEAAALCIEWEHPLGGCDRPFGQDHWALIVEGAPVACAVTASLVSPTIRDETEREWARTEVVELARIARAPGAPWSMRVMLRLWREALAFRWVHWEPQLAATYQLPGTSGHLYAFDGWVKVRKVKRSSPGKGSTWAKPSATDTIGDGEKTLWVYHYPQADTPRPQVSARDGWTRPLSRNDAENPPPGAVLQDYRVERCEHAFDGLWGSEGERQKRCPHCKRWVWEHCWSTPDTREES